MSFSRNAALFTFWSGYILINVASISLYVILLTFGSQVTWKWLGDLSKLKKTPWHNGDRCVANVGGLGNKLAVLLE
jgi:hypothetical protein